jgi:23S rRNA G2445 N2-methylase RlmL
MDPSDAKARFYARTMHTPDDAARARLRDGLRELSRALIPLHRALIEEVKDDYAFAYEAIGTPSRLLQLVQNDPFFAWLKPVTSLIVDIDEMARTDFERADVDRIVARADRLFGATAEGEFTEKYVPLLQRDVDVAMAHATVRQVLTKLQA